MMRFVHYVTALAVILLASAVAGAQTRTSMADDTTRPQQPQHADVLACVRPCVQQCDTLLSADSEDCEDVSDHVCQMVVQRQWLECAHLCVGHSLLTAEQICVAECDVSLLHASYSCGTVVSLQCLLDTYLQYVACKTNCVPVPRFYRRPS